jgi:hypothetical protein
MRLSQWILAVVICSTVAIAGRQAVSQDKAGGKPKIPDPGSEMEKMMQAYAKAAEPGPNHKRLDALVGDWNCHVRVWEAPGGPQQESKATYKRQWILGGRFLQENYDGQFMNKPFSGFGLMGYDNQKKHFVSLWADTMMTCFMTQTGEADASGKVITFSGTMDDPVTGQPKKLKSILRIESDAKNIFEMYDFTPDGKEYKSLEIVSTRG